MSLYYLDTSAAVKLVAREPHSEAMAEWSTSLAGQLASSDLLRTELRRAVRRIDPSLGPRVSEVLRRVQVTGLAAPTFDLAATLNPPAMRSLDALHLAAALELGDELEGIVTYDERMAEAAAVLGLAVVTPN